VESDYHDFVKKCMPCQKHGNLTLVKMEKLHHVYFVSINGLDDLVLEDLMDLMKVLEAIALEHVGTMLTLMKI